MVRNLKGKSLGVRLLAVFVAAVIIPSVILAAVLIRFGVERERAAEFGEMQAVSETVADDVEDFVSDAQAVLVAASLSRAYWESPEQALDDILVTFSYFRRVAVWDSTGRVLSLVGRGGEVWEPSPAVTREAFRTAMRGRLYTSKVQFTAANRPLLLIAVPVRRPGARPTGVITAVISLESAQRVVEGVRFNRSGYAFLVDDRGRVIAYAADEKVIGRDLSGLPPVHDAVSGETDAGLGPNDVYTDVHGKRVVASFRELADLHWAVIVQQPVAIAFGTSRRAVVIALAWTLLFAALFGLLGLYLVRRVTVPIARLRDGAEAMGSGNLGYRIDVRTGDELEELARALNEMAGSLDTSTRKLETEHGRAVRSAREAGTLYRVSQALVSTMDLSGRLRTVARNLASVCGTSRTAIWLLENENLLVPASEHGMSSEEEDVFRGRRIALSEASPATRRAILEHEPVAVHDVAEDPRLPEELVSGLGLRSGLALPLIFQERVTGYAIAFEPGEVRRFTKRQIRLAQAIAAQGAVAVENARAYERERKISETLQRAFLPEVPQEVGRFQIADVYESALAEAQVGGDFYDVIQVSPTKLVLVIADVSGKGLSAAVHTAMVKYTVRAYAVEDADPVAIVIKLNDAVYKYVGGQVFVTLFYGVLDTERATLRYVNAGHELPLLYGEQRGLCMRLATTGTALGIIEKYAYTSESIEFAPGDALLMYTDGATEARRDGKFLGIEGLEEMFCEVASGRASEIARELDTRIRNYARDVLRDDMALLVVKSD